MGRFLSSLPLDDFSTRLWVQQASSSNNNNPRKEGSGIPKETEGKYIWPTPNGSYLFNEVAVLFAVSHQQCKISGIWIATNTTQVVEQNYSGILCKSQKTLFSVVFSAILLFKSINPWKHVNLFALTKHLVLCELNTRPLQAGILRPSSSEIRSLTSSQMLYATLPNLSRYFV